VLDLVSVDHPEQVAAMRRSEAEMQKAKGADLTEASRQTFLDARVLAERLLAEGRAGHLEEDVPEAAATSARQPQSDITADVPPPSPWPKRNHRPLSRTGAPRVTPTRSAPTSPSHDSLDCPPAR
jgi:hypothetical protein